MKKQIVLTIAVLCFGVSLDLQAGYAASKFAKRSNTPVIKEKANPSNPSGSVPTQSQMQQAVAQDPAGAVAAVNQAVANLGIDPSTPNKTILNYIQGIAG